jgi:threonine synthase
VFFCPSCRRRFSTSQPRWRCDCHSYLLGEFNASLSHAPSGEDQRSIWRFRESFGLSGGARPVTLGEGSTPLVTRRIAGREVLCKLDYLCPTGSYKDRGSSVMITKLKEWGIGEIVDDSSGNAGASVAAYAAAAGIRCRIFVPTSTSAGKAAQIAMYGADLVRVPGTREDTERAALQAASDTFYASHNWSPHFLVGMKTVAYEIVEQLDGKAPDWVVTPVGGGSLLLGLYDGFRDMLRAGWITDVPRIAAVQSTRCAPVYEAWRKNLCDVPAVAKGETAAEGIAIAAPVRGRSILEAIRGSKGVVYTVEEDAIWQMTRSLAEQSLYVEPTAAAAPAAISSMVADGLLQADERVAIVLTGIGLKATDKIVEHFFFEGRRGNNAPPR